MSRNNPLQIPPVHPSTADGDDKSIAITMPANCRRALLGIIVLLLVGCGTTDAPEADSDEPKSIGPQFWKYDLSDYAIVGRDVTYGLGGRWISVRRARKNDVQTTKAKIVDRVSEALLADGWSARANDDKQWPAKVWEQSSGDISFHRKARDPEPSYWFFNQRIHVSDDASTICIYAEVGW